MDLQTLKDKFGIEAWDALTSEQVYELLKIAGTASMKKEELHAIVKVAPQFAAMAVAASKALIATTATAAAVQNGAIDGLNKAVSALERLSEKTKSETVELRIVDAILQIANMIRETAQDNNNFWKLVIPAVGASLLAAVGLVLRINRS